MSFKLYQYPLCVGNLCIYTTTHIHTHAGEDYFNTLDVDKHLWFVCVIGKEGEFLIELCTVNMWPCSGESMWEKGVTFPAETIRRFVNASKLNTRRKNNTIILNPLY